jgi:cAMP-dependent protein kinase regulator
MDYKRLEPLAPFAGLTDGERRMLAGILDEHRFDMGQDIVKQGDYGYEFMVIEEGTVDVLHNGEKVDEMGPGGFFGEVGVLSAGGQRNATIRASSPVTLLTLTAHYMREVRSRMPRMGEQIDAAAAARQR